ncbi:hypothetical protein PO909_032196 [Leuciscus waleckii]
MSGSCKRQRRNPPYKSIGGGLQCSAHEAAVLFGKLAARGRGALLSRLWNYEQRWSDQHLVLNIIPTDLRPWSSEPAFSSHSSFASSEVERSFGSLHQETFTRRADSRSPSPFTKYSKVSK